MSASRFGIAILLVRMAGPELFAEYALLLSLLLMAEWLVDFGTTDIAVREICQDSDRESALLSALLMARLLQAAVASLFFMAVLVGLGYAREMVLAGAIGAIGIWCYAGALAARTWFRLSFRMERDVLGELIGVAVMIPLVWVSAAMGMGIVVLMACYVVSRLVFCGINLALAWKGVPKSLALARWVDVRSVWLAAIPLGVLGMLVALYDALAPVLLSKLVGFVAVAHFAASMRFIMPVFVIVQALGSTTYTLFASYWQVSMDDFRRTQEETIAFATFVGAGCFCVLHANAEFFMSWLGPEMAPAADILRWLSWIILSRTITTILTPIIIVTGGQRKALWLTIFVLTCKVCALLILIPQWGIMGAVWGYVTVEFVAGALPFMLFSRALLGVRVNWSTVIRIILCACAALALPVLAGLSGTPAGGLLAPLGFVALALATNTIQSRKLVAFLGSVRQAKQPATEP